MLSTLILFAVIVVLGILAVKFLAGMIRTVVTIGLFLVGLGIVLSVLTGHNLVGPPIGAAVAMVKSAINSTG